MGKPAAMDAITAIAKKHGLYVIEDAAEAHGAEYKGRKVGSIGDMAAFSLYAAHIITTIEGGIVITDNSQMADVLRSLRNHGIVGKFEFKRIGFSAKMNEIEAAVGIGNIKIFDRILEKRRRNLLTLIEKFKQFENYFITIKEESGEKIGPHAFSIIVRADAGFTKEEFVGYIESRGIDSRNLFYSIPTQCPSYAFLGKKLGDFPEAEFCSDHGTHIGIHQDIELKDLDYVESVVSDFLKSKK
jgi:dTDP-4-amino-4,6-dideoxygalactose transaminase